MSESNGRPGPRRTWLALGYCLVGPLILLATGNWEGAVFIAIVALVAFAILRPGSDRRSAWRATTATLWLAFPLASTAAFSVPMFEVMEKRRVDLDEPGAWLTLWLAGGLVACIVTAIHSAVPRRSVETPAPPPPEAPVGRANARPWIRLGLVVGSLAGIVLGVGYVYMISSLFVSVSRSHIAANAPAVADFDRLMKRDLAAWFVARDPTVSAVDYELLRKQPTQAGIAPPKYYVWVTARSASGAKQGAARVMALERVRFQITDFLTSEEILARPDRMRSVFPAGLSAAITRHAQNAMAREEVSPKAATGGR